MVKNLKINIKNAQIADALNIDSSKIKRKKTVTKKKAPSTKASLEVETPKKPKARIVRTRPAFEEKKEVENLQQPTAPIEKTVTKSTKDVQKPKPVETPLPKIKNPKTTEKKAEVVEEKTKEPSKKKQTGGFKEFRDFRALRRKEHERSFDSRDRQGLRSPDDEGWRKRRSRIKKSVSEEISIVRPKNLHIRLPISIKDLASEMKRKASELLSKLFMQGVVITLNDFIDDETTVQLLGHEFECEITIDTSEEERIRITDKTIKQEIDECPRDVLKSRSPIITFMGHVDHGKTSLIDAIRQTDIVSGEAGAITQHIGAFKTKVPSGEITILDTPGHEAFSEMRIRGANVTDIVVLVIAGDEGMRDQTLEAIQKAKEANVPIVVAINKCDKENFDAEKVYRQLSEVELLPEAWGGSTITINCSAQTKEGIPELLELVLLQSEMLELKANPNMRARGTVLESQMHKGLGAVATVLVQNGILNKNDALVFGDQYGRIKTMQDEHNRNIEEALPSTPVKITGLSGLAEAGSEFIVVKDEKEAKNLAEARREGLTKTQQAKKMSMENLLSERKAFVQQKVLPIILRADVQGSLEALKQSLFKIKSEKARIEIVNEGIGEISESDVELASASKALILGFHTRIESNAESLMKQFKIPYALHNIIYHAVDSVKSEMQKLLDKIPEELDQGKALVKTTFKSSQVGVIAGCLVEEGTIKRSHLMKLIRNGEQIWKGKIASIKRVKEDVKEVQKGTECGIVLEGTKDVQEEDILQAYEIVYHEQEL